MSCRFVLVAVTVAVVVALALVPRVAGANAAAPPPAERVGSLQAEAVGDAKTPLAVTDAALRIDCRGGTSCALEVHYTISNPTDAPVAGTASFYGASTEGMHVTVDGHDANVGLDAAAKAKYDATVADASDEREVSSMVTSDVAQQGFSIELAAHATAAVVVTGTLVAVLHRGYDSFALGADRARHLVFNPKIPSREHIRLDYLIAPIRTWGAFPKDMAFTLVHPAGWDAWVAGVDLATRTDGGRRVHEGRVETSRDSLFIDLDLGDPGFPLRGGVFAAIGGNVDDATGVRTRLGGELVWRRSYFTSVAFEIESGSPTAYVIVPAVEVASPMILLIPSLGAGLGVPVRISPSFEVGVRVQLDAHVGPIGWFVAFDTYPGMEAGPRRFEVAMMAQLSI